MYSSRSTTNPALHHKATAAARLFLLPNIYVFAFEVLCSLGIDYSMGSAVLVDTENLIHITHEGTCKDLSYSHWSVAGKAFVGQSILPVSLALGGSRMAKSLGVESIELFGGPHHQEILLSCQWKQALHRSTRVCSMATPFKNGQDPG